MQERDNVPFRVTYFFELQGDRLGGWSENFWNNSASFDSLLPKAQELGGRLIIAKGGGVLWTRTRISVPGSPRNTITLINNPARQSGPMDLTSVNAPDYQVTKWLLQLAGPKPPSTQPGGNTTVQWIGGVTDRSIIGAYLQPAAVIGSLFPQVVSRLTNSGNNWCIYVLNPTIGPIPVVSINPTTGLVTCGSAINFPNGSLVRVSRIHNLTAANGLWRVTVNPIDNTQFTLNNWKAQTNVMDVSPKANVRWQTYSPLQIQGASVVRSSNHKVGRPTGQFGGRAKT
jgi:hypothetical protein